MSSASDCSDEDLVDIDVVHRVDLGVAPAAQVGEKGLANTFAVCAERRPRPKVVFRHVRHWQRSALDDG